MSVVFCSLQLWSQLSRISLCSSKNYRSIAISSLFLKIIDWIIILLYGESLQLDDLQFAYQPSCSTNMCTWLVVETIDYFLRNGGEVFACSMDMTKAFDLVVHSKLLRKLLDASMPANSNKVDLGHVSDPVC